MNDNEFYNFCMKELTKYEDNYDIDPFDSLKKTIKWEVYLLNIRGGNAKS